MSDAITPKSRPATSSATPIFTCANRRCVRCWRIPKVPSANMRCRGRAVALGWRQEQVVVIDSDLGQSGACAADREGFQRLVTEVSLGHAGIVMGLEVSRLARNSTDWHRLLELCALADTLILDEDGVYDPAHFNDRLLLGLKGTMSEAELHVLRARLRGGILNKARRGELEVRLPIGFVYDARQRVLLDPDARVRETVRQLFRTFSRTGSASATVKAFCEQGLTFPRRVFHGPHKGEVLWSELEHSQVLRVLHHPRYAGAFCFGRSRQRRHPDGHTVCVPLAPRGVDGADSRRSRRVYRLGGVRAQPPSPARQRPRPGGGSRARGTPRGSGLVARAGGVRRVRGAHDAALPHRPGTPGA
jgi:DNA invertase Pin-like site-specific DNA recombinase